MDVTFKDIIACYRKQPQYRPDTIRTVALKHNAPLPDVSPCPAAFHFPSYFLQKQIREEPGLLMNLREPI